MALNGQVAAAAPGLLGYDTQVLVNAASAAQAATKYKFCVRYVSRTQALRDQHARNGTPDLSEAEAQTILDAGMAVMAVQHPPAPGWAPTAALGTAYGHFAASCAGQAGMPAGVNLWLDLEGVAPGTTAADATAYCNAWFTEVATAGYVPGLYVGVDCGLDSNQLYALKTRHYWKAGSRVPDVSRRSYQLIQSCLHDLDTDLTCNDHLGGQVLWLAP